MRPIATPLALGGFSGAVGDTSLGRLPRRRLRARCPTARPAVAAQAASAARRRSSRGSRPGDAVGVNLITGDFIMGATGTVTEVDGDQVYAFGHPFYNLGTTEFPMTRAYVYALLPSLLSSMKIATTGETIGTFRQDRATAIAGTLGQGPDMVPIRICARHRARPRTRRSTSRSSTTSCSRRC